MTCTDGMTTVRIEADVAAVVTVPALLSVATVARLLDCSPRTVRRRIAEDALPAVKEGDRVMIRGDELRSYVDGLGRVGAPRPRARRSGSSVDRSGFDFLRD
jgi:excisionase family DNA binding protein